MRAVFSLNTSFFHKWKFEQRILLYKYSMSLARKYYKVILYTDKLGEQKLKSFADEIILLHKSNKDLWSEPKLQAIEREPSSTLHLDGDIFLYEKLMLPNTDISYDRNERNLYESHYRDSINLFERNNIKQVFKEWNTNFAGCFNIGILKFKNDTVKTKYIDTFKTLKDWYLNSLDDIEKEKINITQTSMTLEEYSLTCLAEYYKWTSTELCTLNSYEHKFGLSKYSEEFIGEVRRKLKNETLY